MDFFAMAKSDKYSMNEVEILLKEIRQTEIEKKTEVLNHDLKQKLQRCHNITAGQNNFVNNVCSDESKMQAKIVYETKMDEKVSNGSIMLSGHVVGQWLKMIAEMAGARSFLDIGTFTGYSAISLAETAFCEEVISLDNNEYTKVFVEDKIAGTPLENKIQVKIGPALESLAELHAQGKCFDMIFIDADKPGYIEYYKYIMDNRLLRVNGTILCDNIFFFNETILERNGSFGQALYDFVNYVKSDDRVDQLILPVRDGLMLIKSKAKSV